MAPADKHEVQPLPGVGSLDAELVGFDFNDFDIETLEWSMPAFFFFSTEV